MAGGSAEWSVELNRAAAAVAGAVEVAALTGAGISAESGVPTFRGPGGLWKNRRAEEVATPRAFAADPKLVWEFYNYRRRLLLDVRPNPGHLALAELEALLDRFTLITQNVDGLHRQAGSRRLLEVHGNIWFVTCTGCGGRFDRTGQQLGELPRCGECGGLLRPAVVWFGESLPPDVWAAAQQAAEQCGCLLVVGTSARVHPAAGLVWLAKQHGATVVEVNLERTPASTVADVGLYGPAGVVLPALLRAIKKARPASL